MASATAARRLLLVSDLDGTIIDSEGKYLPKPVDGVASYIQRFNDYWRRRQAQGDVFVVCTGNCRTQTLKLFEEFRLLRPDALVCDTGASAYSGPELDQPLDWISIPKATWSKRKVLDALAPLKPKFELNPAMYPNCAEDPTSSLLKHSVVAESRSAADEIVAAIRALPFESLVSVHSEQWRSEFRGAIKGVPYIDVMPPSVHKGSAVERLQQLFPAALTVVAGDSGNDLSMFAREDVRGVAVGNALAELKTFIGEDPGRSSRCLLASATCADGVVEGLTHWLKTVEDMAQAEDKTRRVSAGNS